jgi:hypothetical protein
MKRATRRSSRPALPKEKAAGRGVGAKPTKTAPARRPGAAAARKLGKARASAASTGRIGTAGSDATGVVRSALEDYARRGVFSGFEEVAGQGGKTIFRFVWLHDGPMELTLEPSKKALRFDRFLPGVKPGTPFARDLKGLLEKLSSKEMPDYRRVDPARAALSCSIRRDHLSIAIVVKKDDYQYAINRMVNVAHELFVYLRSDWPEYLVEHFNEPEE